MSWCGAPSRSALIFIPSVPLEQDKGLYLDNPRLTTIML